MSLKIGITNTSYNVYSDAADEKIKLHGYDCVDYQGLTRPDAIVHSLEGDELDEYLDGIRAHYESVGLEIAQAHSTWPLPKNDNEECDLYVKAIERTLYCASKLGCPRLIVHTVWPFSGSDERAHELNVGIMRRMGEYAGTLGVTLCVENLPFRDHYASSVESVCRIVDEVNLPSVKVCLDTGHTAILGLDAADAVRYIGPRLEALHVHDNHGFTDEHLPPGEGVIDWDAFATALRDVGYQGVLSIETSAKHHLYPADEWEARERALMASAVNMAKKASK